MNVLRCIGTKIDKRMILHQRTSLKSKRNKKGTEKKLMRYGNERALYALVRKKSSELFHVFSELCTRGGYEYDQDRALPYFPPVGYLETTLRPQTNNIYRIT